MKKKTKRIILVTITCFILLAAGFTIIYRDAIFQRGNPLPYISKMVTLNDDNPCARVFDDQDVFIIKNAYQVRYGNGALIKNIEDTYDVTYREQMGGCAFFDSDEKTMIADIEVYFRYYEVWELTVI